MRADTTRSAPARLTDGIGLAIAVALLVTCLTLVFLAMRSVMDVGGACADGGPYVSAQPCPDGVPLAMIGGIFGIFVFGALVWRFGAAVGEPFTTLPFLAWPALFGSLGWNFLDYGILSPPEGHGIVWGWLIPGVLFELMAFVPLVGLIAALRSAGPSSSGRAAPLAGPGQPARSASARATGSRALPRPSLPRPAAPTTARQAALSGLAASFGTAAALTAASARLGGARGGRGGADLDAGPAAALVDRLEALAELREQGLLEEREYDAAKAAVLRDLEALP